MKVTYLLKYLIVLVTGVLLISSCKKESSDPNWDVDILAPLLKSTLTIDDIVADSLTNINPDSSISLVYQNEIYRFNLDSLFSIPDTSIEYTAKLSNLDLGTIEITLRKSLGDIALYDLDENGYVVGGLYDIIMTGHNTGNPTAIAAIDQQIYDLNADLTDYFQTITVIDGYIDIEFDNGMPIDFEKVAMELRNHSNSLVILQDTFDLVPAFSSESHSRSIAGKTIEGNLDATVMFESPGSSGDVTIDTSMAMEVTIRVRDVSIESATAVFPSQNIVDQGSTTSFNNNDIQLTYAIVREGKIYVQVFNTIEEDLHYEFTVPGAIKNSNQLAISGTVPAASGGNPGQSTINSNIAGYTLNLKGIGPIEQQVSSDLNGNGFTDADTVNTLYYTLTGRIDSSGNLISLSLNDSVYVNVSFTDIIPEYAKGYLGQEIVSVSGTEEFDIFTNILDGTFNLDDVKLSISVANQIGVAGDVAINSIIAKNTSNNNTVNLDIPSQYDPFAIAKPFDPNTTIVPITPTINTIILDKSNSNSDELIEIMPDIFDYSLDFQINASTPPPPLATGTDFVYYNSEVVASLDIEIPLSFIANNITLIDTAKFSLNETDVENINGGKIILYADNGYPLNAVVQLYLLDEFDMMIDSLLPNNATIEAGNYDFTTDKVSSKKKTKIEIPIPVNRIGDLINTKKIKIVTRFTTNPYNTYVKIYSTYSIDIILVGDFSYHVN